MNRISLSLVVLALALHLNDARAQSAFTYQGQLKNGNAAATGAYDFQFTLFDAPINGAAVGPAFNRNGLGLTNGLFSTELDFGAAAFNGSARWLEVAVRPAGSGGGFTSLTPRQRVTPSPYALYAPSAGSVPDGAVTSPKLATSAVTFDKLGTTAGPSPGQLLAYNGVSLIWESPADNSWNLTGNSGTLPGVNFLGTKDKQPMEIRVNNARVWRMEPNAGSPNLIGGFSENEVRPGVQGGAISGGGSTGLANAVTDDFGFVGGGEYNQAGKDGVVNFSTAYATAGGGYGNLASDFATTIAGGYLNFASSNYSAVVGGYNNFATGPYALVGGGYANTASGDSATVSGGYTNAASGLGATISGGEQNVASRDYATVGGGLQHLVDADYGTIGGGYFNTITDTAGAVSGGQNNASGYYGFVGGGYFNNATNDFAMVGGGSDNEAAGFFSTVAGGGTNVVRGDFATIPGGRLNFASGNLSFAAGNRAVATNTGAFVWADSTEADLVSDSANQFVARASGGVKFFSNAGASSGVRLSPGGGSWSNLSDRAAKEKLAAVNTRDVLDRLNQIPIQTWKYKSQDASIRHIGPIAQDFYAAFGVGEDEKHITNVDADGVALAAIQGLTQVLKEKETKLESLEKRVAELEAVVKALAKR